MDVLPDSNVIFRRREMKKSQFSSLIDALLVPWMSVEENSRRRLGRVGIEIDSYAKMKEQEEVRSSGAESFFRLFSQCEEVPDFRSAFTVIAQICKRVEFIPERDIATELGEIIHVLIGDDDEDWRENSNLEINPTGDELSKVFRHCVWTLRQLDDIAERIVEHSPHDIGVRNLFDALRSYAYQQAKTLASSAINTSQFYIELGPESFCPDKAVRTFWTEVGLEQEARKAHPIDRQLGSDPKFITTMRVFNRALEKHGNRGTITLADRAAATELHGQIEFILGLWAKAMGDLFHLGPTIGLIKWTDAIIAQMEKWLTLDENVKDHGKAFTADANAAIAGYRKAKEPLAEALKPKTKS